jgi:hypothetical protein
MQSNTVHRSFRAIMASFSIVIMFGLMSIVQSCDTPGDKGNSEGGGYNGGGGYEDDTTNYKDKANDLVDRLYAAESADEIEPILMDIFTILGVPVYNHNKTALVVGSGSLTQGMALRDYQVYVLADSFFRYRQNTSRHTTAKAFADGAQNLGGDNAPVYVDFGTGEQTEDTLLNEGKVYYAAQMYQLVSMVWGMSRPYFLADLFTALAVKNPDHSYNSTNFYLDPLQAFLMKLDWFSTPLNPADYISLSYMGTVSPELSRAFSLADVSPRDMDSVKGYWSIAQYVVGAAIDELGNVLDVGGIVAGEIIADGTQISIECDSPMYYGSGEHTITISVAFNVDLSKFATDYGWTVGVDLPEVGPIKRAKVALVGWEDLAPEHGLFSGGNLDVLRGLAAGGAIANDSGEVSVNFTVKDQSDTTCTDEDQAIVKLVAEVNPITDPTAWQSGIFNSIFPRSMPTTVYVRWKKSTSNCGGGGGSH